ncbi:MAG: RNA 2',3'-cyclic phosphodiesterase [Chthoniobacterales bacterium]
MSKRLFVAIDLPDSTRRSLVDLDPHIHGVRWVDGNQMHLTLGFFEHVPDDVDSCLREKLSAIEFKAFFLPIIGLGKFPAKGQPKIIWIGVGAGHPHLFQVHKRVQESAFQCGLEPELRPFHAHITLARCRDVHEGAVQKFLKANADLDVEMVRVESFHLYSSELTPAGPIHTRELTLKAIL